jgi:two-component system, chemotaxis family, protein-glutamate methylesterase/glutaminase
VSENLNVLIVDDNLTYRRFLSRVLEMIEGVVVLPPAAGGKIALARMMSTRVDLVFLDMRMPDMSGLETLRRIREAHPDAGVIMISGEYGCNANTVVQALELGALDFIPKDFLESGSGGENGLQSLKAHLSTLCRQFRGRRDLNRAKRISITGRGGAAPPTGTDPLGGSAAKACGAFREAPAALIFPPFRPAPPGKIDVVVIGASTGGPMALGQVIPALPANLRAPVLIVQHMPALLTRSLAQSLDKKSAITVCEASEGAALRPGTAYLAQGGKHLLVKPGVALQGDGAEHSLALEHGPPENSVRPSADVLFRSAAGSFKGNILAVIMTGMGSDGMKGVEAMKERGCYCITQCPESCVVYGMPRAVAEAGLSDETVHLAGIAKRIVELVGTDGNRRVP